VISDNVRCFENKKGKNAGAVTRQYFVAKSLMKVRASSCSDGPGGLDWRFHERAHKKNASFSGNDG
jgi:hypothetical protein